MQHIEIKTGSTVYTPYYNLWNKAVYLRNKAFDEYPCLIDAGSTSGAPVIIGENFFIGIKSLGDARFRWDGEVLQIDAQEDAIFQKYNFNNLETVWKDYYQSLNLSYSTKNYGNNVEYCTWVEQYIKAGNEGLKRAEDAMDMQMIVDMLQKVDKYPKGRFTVDYGWSYSFASGGFGDWQAKSNINIKEIADRILDAGHIPGLWLAACLIDSNSDIALKNPELIGEKVKMLGEGLWNKFHYVKPSAMSQSYFDKLFKKIWDWGFRKVKLDIFYGPKNIMAELLAQCRNSAKKLSDSFELEGHIPDPFCSQYFDVLRLNDVLISPEFLNWKNVVNEHFNICRLSSPEHLLNLDHIGGNNINIAEEQFIEHISIMNNQLFNAYPVVSLLPEHIGIRASKALEAFMNKLALGI